MSLLNFSKRPPFSILYVTQSKVMQADMDKQGELVNEIASYEIECHSINDLPDCLMEWVKASKPRLGKKVWILNQGITTDEIGLPAMQTAGIDDLMLQKSLRFEYEALSGEITATRLMAHALLNTDGDMSYYWISLIQEDIFKRLQVVIGKASARLNGVAHPGGLPVMLSDPKERHWMRIEYWSDSVTAIHCTPKTGTNLQIYQGGQQSGHWREEMNRWIEAVGEADHTEALIADDVDFTEGQDDHAVSLGKEDVLYGWLHAWGQKLQNQDKKPVPVIQQAPKGLGVNKEILLSVAAGAGALLIVGGHYGWNWYQKTTLEQDIKALKAIEGRIKSVRTSVKSRKDQQDKLEADLAKLSGDFSKIPDVVKAVRERPARLLEALATSAPDNLLVDEFTFTEHGLTLAGYALYPYLANDLMRAMKDKLEKPTGWRINAPTRKDLKGFKQGGPWSFTLKIRDLGIAGFDPEARQSRMTHSTMAMSDSAQ